MNFLLDTEYYLSMVYFLSVSLEVDHVSLTHILVQHRCCGQGGVAAQVDFSGWCEPFKVKP